jgi:hypothetical protein
VADAGLEQVVLDAPLTRLGEAGLVKAMSYRLPCCPRARRCAGHHEGHRWVSQNAGAAAHSGPFPTRAPPLPALVIGRPLAMSMPDMLAAVPAPLSPVIHRMR